MNAAPKPAQRIVSGDPHLIAWLRSVSLEDVITATHHSQDFNGSRAEYIYVRVRLISLLFAVLAPIWIPVDYFVLPAGKFLPILGLRLAFSGLFLLLGLWTAQPYNLRTARLRLLFFTLIPAAFYVGSRLVLGETTPDSGVLVGYSFLPFLMVVLLAVFPLSLLEGMVLSLLPGAVLIGSELWAGTLFRVATLGDLWLLGLLAVVGWWAETAQLHMLLRLYREATRDALTGLVNRRVFSGWLAREVGEAQERGRPLSVLLFDLDLFKRINDTHGHLSGDAVLRAFSRLLDRELTDSNLIGRYGGEEFLAVLPAQGAAEASALAERIRGACHSASVLGPDGSEIRFTTSIGVAELKRGESAEQLLSRVDQGLYRAKEAGRDMVVVAGGG